MTCSTMKFIYPIILFALMQTVISVLSEKPPAIKYISKDQLVDRGSLVKLICSVENDNKAIVRWLKTNENNQSTVVTERFGETNDKYFLKFSVDKNITTYGLTIKNFDRYDNGIYECTLMLSLDKKISSQQVKVYVKNSASIYSVTPSHSIKLGDTIVMQCFASGTPEPIVSWKRDRGLLFSDGELILRKNAVTIRNSRITDEGEYICTAANGIGDPDEKKVNIKILFPPVVKTPHEEVTLNLDSTTDLKCEAKAFPPSEIVWKKNGKLLSNDHDTSINISSSITSEYDSVSILHFVLSQKDQFGYYSCIASNDLGKSETKIYLRGR